MLQAVMTTSLAQRFCPALDQVRFTEMSQTHPPFSKMGAFELPLFGKSKIWRNQYPSFTSTISPKLYTMNLIDVQPELLWKRLWHGGGLQWGCRTVILPHCSRQTRHILGPAHGWHPSCQPSLPACISPRNITRRSTIPPHHRKSSDISKKCSVSKVLRLGSGNFWRSMRPIIVQGLRLQLRRAATLALTHRVRRRSRTATEWQFSHHSAQFPSLCMRIACRRFSDRPARHYCCRRFRAGHKARESGWERFVLAAETRHSEGKIVAQRDRLVLLAAETNPNTGQCAEHGQCSAKWFGREAGGAGETAGAAAGTYLGDEKSGTDGLWDCEALKYECLDTIWAG